MKVAVFSTKSFDQEYFNRFNDGEKHQITYHETRLKESTVNLAQGFDAVCVFVNDRINARIIDKLSAFGIKLIALRCAGFNNVDLEAAESKGITVVRVPAYSPQAVAEHALALILTLNRKTHKAYNRVREGNFSVERLTGFNLSGKTVGVIGTGAIGAHFCRIMHGINCTVYAHDPYPSDTLKALGIEYVSFDRLLETADIISLHCPLTPETRYLINWEGFARMKPGVMLINTSRGPLINTADAIQALKRGKLGYLGIDVYEQEEKLFFRDLSESIIQDDDISRLMTFPNVLITAHQGFFTTEALEEITKTTLQNITDFQEGKELVNQVQLESAKG
jgi:D-lactate dehydrogenase